MRKKQVMKLLKAGITPRYLEQTEERVAIKFAKSIGFSMADIVELKERWGLK